VTSAAAAKFANFLHRVGEYLNYVAFFAVLVWIWFDDLITAHNADIGEIAENTVWRIVWTTLLVHFVSWLIKRLGYASDSNA
jgi:hypothetical protein